MASFFSHFTLPLFPVLSSCLLTLPQYLLPMKDVGPHSLVLHTEAMWMWQHQGCHANAGIRSRHIPTSTITLQNFLTLRLTKHQITVEILRPIWLFGATRRHPCAGNFVPSQCVKVSARFQIGLPMNNLRTKQNCQHSAGDIFKWTHELFRSGYLYCSSWGYS